MIWVRCVQIHQCSDCISAILVQLYISVFLNTFYFFYSEEMLMYFFLDSSLSLLLWIFLEWAAKSTMENGIWKWLQYSITTASTIKRAETIVHQISHVLYCVVKVMISNKIVSSSVLSNPGLFTLCWSFSLITHCIIHTVGVLDLETVFLQYYQSKQIEVCVKELFCVQ